MASPAADPRRETVPAWEHSASADYLAKFVAACGSTRTAERYDSEAARIYHLAEDPAVQGDQSHVIRTLLERRRNTVSVPLVTSYEEHDPHFGHWTTSLLTFGEYGDHKFANNNYVRLNRPPATVPPGMLQLHFCWGAGFDGSAAGSTLNALAALVLDDWRSALSGLPIRFHLHRMGPAPSWVVVGLAGPRWRSRTAGQLPTEKAVGILFERANRARALNPFEVNDQVGGSRNWWCALLSAADLPWLGFQRTRLAPGLGERVLWTARGCLLPKAIEHVLVIPDRSQPGAFCRVSRLGQVTNLLSLEGSREHSPEAHHERFRVSSLDVALSALLERMR